MLLVSTISACAIDDMVLISRDPTLRDRPRNSEGTYATPGYGAETVNWESSRVGRWMTQPGEWQDTPPLDSSSASRARYSNNHARSPSTS